MTEVAEVSRLRVPPHSEEAEQGVLGGLLSDNNAFDRVAGVLTEADFYRQDHRLIFAAIAALIARSQPADVVTVFEQLQSQGKAADCGGMQHINALAQSVSGSSNVRRYAEIVRERAVYRAVIAACDDGATAAFNPQGKTAADVVDGISAKLSALSRQQMRKAPRVLRDFMAGRIDRVNALADGKESPGLTTGVPRLDRALVGLKGGRLIVLAARPSVGKSSFAEAVGLHVARCYGPALMLSQEMTGEEVSDRALSHLGRINHESLQTGSLDQDEWHRLPDAVEEAGGLPFWIDDQPALRLRDIKAKARQVKGLRFLIVDYLQLSEGDGDNRTQQIGSLSRGLKQLAKELDIPVLVLSQLNRKVDERPGREPVLSDLRDSGEIEQDADVVLFLWPLREYEGGAKLVGLKVDKNRGGRLARFAMDFNGAHQRWHESTAEIPSGKKSTGGDL